MWPEAEELKRQLRALCDLDDPIEDGDILDILDSVERMKREQNGEI